MWLCRCFAKALKAAGIVLRSCVTSTRCKLAAISKTSESLLPDNSASS